MAESKRWASLFRRNAGDAKPIPPGVLETENHNLRRAIEELTTLNDLAREIGGCTEPDTVMDKITRRSMKAVGAEQAVITMIERDDSDDMKTLVRVQDSIIGSNDFHLDRILKGWMLLNKKPLLSNDPHADERLRGIRLDDTVQSLLCVPLLFRSEVIGVLTAYNKRGMGNFDAEDQRLLAIIGSQSAQVIENARMCEEQKAMAVLQEQIRLARDIQLDLLPDAPPQIGGYEIAGHSIPAQDVGGDYFDFIADPEGLLAFCLGDVSGKGLPASLLMANLQATLRGQTLRKVPVTERIGHANNLLRQSTDAEKFATLFYALLDPVAGTVHYCCAGHEHPLLLRGAETDAPAERLGVGGLILGILPDFEYSSAEVSLEPKDILVVFSDGVSDAENEAGEPFGEATLEALVREHRDKTAAELVDLVNAAVANHAGDAEQFDDVTIVILKRDGA